MRVAAVFLIGLVVGTIVLTGPHFQDQSRRTPSVSVSDGVNRHLVEGLRLDDAVLPGLQDPPKKKIEFMSASKRPSDFTASAPRSSFVRSMERINETTIRATLHERPTTIPKAAGGGENDVEIKRVGDPKDFVTDLPAPKENCRVRIEVFALPIPSSTDFEELASRYDRTKIDPPTFARDKARKATAVIYVVVASSRSPAANWNFIQVLDESVFQLRDRKTKAGEAAAPPELQSSLGGLPAYDTIGETFAESQLRFYFSATIPGDEEVNGAVWLDAPNLRQSPERIAPATAVPAEIEKNHEIPREGEHVHLIEKFRTIIRADCHGVSHLIGDVQFTATRILEHNSAPLKLRGKAEFKLDKIDENPKVNIHELTKDRKVGEVDPSQYGGVKKIE